MSVTLRGQIIVKNLPGGKLCSLFVRNRRSNDTTKIRHNVKIIVDGDHLKPSPLPERILKTDSYTRTLRVIFELQMRETFLASCMGKRKISGGLSTRLKT